MSSLPPSQNDYIYVPVHVDQVDAVLRYLAELRGFPPTKSEPGLERSVQRVYLESEPKFRDLLRFLADSPGRPISSAEVARGISLPSGPASLAGMLGAYARRSNNRYEGFWPFERLSNPTDETTELMMSAEVATMVKGLAPSTTDPADP